MKRNPLTITALALTLAVGGAMTLHARLGDGFHGPFQGDFGAAGGPGLMLERMAEHLDLSPEQREQVAELMEVQRSASQPVFEQMRSLSTELDERLEAGDASAIEVGELVLEIHAQRQAVEAQHEEFRSQLESILTPEQLEAMPARERFEGRRGFRGRRGFGRQHGPGVRTRSELPSESPSEL